MIVHPTHTCFDDALDIFDHVPISDNYVVVHGICNAPAGPFAHAWVEERGKIIWQGGILDGRRGYYAMSLGLFYMHFAITKTSRYSIKQAAYLNGASGHYGPWRDEYKQLLGSEVRARLVPPEPIGWFYV